MGWYDPWALCAKCAPAGQLRLEWVQAERSWGAHYKECPGQVTGAKVSASKGGSRALCPGWLEPQHELGVPPGLHAGSTLVGRLGPRQMSARSSRWLCSRGALASQLKLKWYQFGVLCTCITLAQRLGTVVSTNWGSPRVHYSVANLVGWLGLVRARGPGLTEVVGHLWSLNPVLVCTFKGERERRPPRRPAPSTQREFQRHLAEF